MLLLEDGEAWRAGVQQEVFGSLGPCSWSVLWEPAPPLSLSTPHHKMISLIPLCASCRDVLICTAPKQQSPKRPGLFIIQLSQAPVRVTGSWQKIQKKNHNIIGRQKKKNDWPHKDWPQQRLVSRHTNYFAYLLLVRVQSSWIWASCQFVMNSDDWYNNAYISLKWYAEQQKADPTHRLCGPFNTKHLVGWISSAGTGNRSTVTLG